MSDPLLLKEATQVVAAIAALGTAASGLVDATKAVPYPRLNVSYRGRKAIVSVLQPFAPALTNVLGTDWQTPILGHWINGAAMDSQKANAKSIIRLGLDTTNAPAIAEAAHVDPVGLKTAIDLLQTGGDLGTAQINVLGRLDATVDAVLDAAYERADQQYRNTAKFLAGVFAVLLALSGDVILSGGWGKALGDNAWLAVIVGIVAVPLAPMAKDLTTALQTAVKTIGSVSLKKS